jgi:hypothetical protein
MATTSSAGNGTTASVRQVRIRTRHPIAHVYVILEDGRPVYVGCSTNTTRRWYGHTGFARRGTRSPLYVAMREHGIDRFTMVILCSDPLPAALDLERRMIARLGTHVDQGGYNTTAGGDYVLIDPAVRARHKAAMPEVARRRAADPEKRANHREAMRRLHADPDFRARLQEAFSTPEASAARIANHRAAVAEKARQRAKDRPPAPVRRRLWPRPVIAGGMSFASTPAAAAHFGVTKQAIYENIRTGRPGYHYADQPPPPPRCGRYGGRPGRSVTVEGQTFPSIKAAAAALGVDRSTVYVRLTSPDWPDWYYLDERPS